MYKTSHLLSPLQSVFGSPYSPIQRAISVVTGMFAAGEQGAWYDPSDLSTLFQDSAGATPVTAVEQPVGLMLDKRLGLVRGAELVTNGSFDTSGTWINQSTGTGTATIAGGVATLSGIDTSNRGKYAQSITLEVGSTYELIYTIVSGTANSQITCNTLDKFGASVAGTYSIKFIASLTSVTISFNVYGSGTVVFDNISVKKIAGNHATQATAINRPVLSARYNALTYTEQFDNAIWQKIGGGVASAPVVTPNAALAPDGTMTADQIVFNLNGGTTLSDISYLGFGSMAYLASVAYTQSIYLQTSDGSTKVFTYVSQDGITSTITVTGAYQRFTLTSAPASGGSSNPQRLRLRGGEGTASSATLNVWGAQLETGATATRYQRVNTSTDYDTAGFNKFATFNGTNSSMAATTGGGGTSGFFYCQAIKPTGGAGTVRALWSDAGTNTGYRVRINASNQLELSAGNGTTYTTIATAATLPVGETHLITAWDDGTNLKVQIDSGAIASVARPAVSAGTAGFTIGTNNGTAADWFAGKMYPSVYRQTAPTASQIASTQLYCKAKAGL